MPAFVASLKSISEATIQLLTLLLQVMVSQLEQPNVETEINSLESPETSQQLSQVMTELQNQRNLLETLIQEQGQRRERLMTASVPTGMTTSPPLASSSTTRTGPAPTSRINPPVTVTRTPTGSIAASVEWTLAELEEENFMIDQGFHPEEVLDPPHIAMLANAAPPTAPRATRPVSQALAVANAPSTLTLQEWGQRIITWGKKHRGKSFAQAMTLDPGYLTWCQARFNSLPPDQQDFVRFGQMFLSRNA